MLRWDFLYTQLLNNLKDGTLYAVCISVKPGASMQAITFLDSAHLKESCSMGKRMAISAEAEAEVSFGERLASLRKAAGFTLSLIHI